ncbi:MAG TPA: SAM-dependent methyltransferase [Candidatus Nanoarchaeia archaeon]|nr:SAM-dependent methyltransferase [Candidatus Nanoarchaeia archaeon]
MKYIIEHLEKRLYKWCFLEYKHISTIVGKENLIFTRLNKSQAEKLKGFGACYTKSVAELNFEKMCVLDLEAEKVLTEEDAKRFEYLVFGGILGDNPPRKRTRKELILKDAERRNIGKEQLPTDNSVFVCKQIVQGKKFEEIEFQDEVEIKIKEGESIILPFRYVLVNGKPLISNELLHYIKTRKGF